MTTPAHFLHLLRRKTAKVRHAILLNLYAEHSSMP